MKKKVACYVRVSMASQHASNQWKEIDKWLGRNGIDASRIEAYEDIDSGAKIDREGFLRLQDDVEAGQIGTVVIWRLDRLSRSLVDGVHLLGQWLDRGVRLVSISQNLDFSGTVGKMIASMLFGVAEMEREAMLARQRPGIERAKMEGKYKGRKRGTTKKRPYRAKQLRSKGLSTEEIATAMGVSRRTVFRYLRE